VHDLPGATLRDREQVLRTAVFRWDFRPATAGIEPGAVFHAIWRIKKRLFSPGGVANPRGTTRYRCGLRLARTKNPSFLFVPSSVKHCTSALTQRVNAIEAINDRLHAACEGIQSAQLPFLG
jgi:hypothetical protein